MCSRTDVTQIKNDYTHFKVKLLSSTGATITSQIGTPDADGYMDITHDNVTVIGTTVAAKAGQVTIPYAVAHNNGDSISGVIVAY
jgi:ethanolamine utilization microcompartment shell protein EutS